MMTKKITATLLAIFLSGCISSTPAGRTHYYLLNAPDNNEAQEANLITEPDFVLERIRVPDYLLQPNLVMQLSDNKLHQANLHRWAEAIPDSVAKVLVDELQSQGMKIHDHSESDINTNRLFVQITHFYPTDKSDVILSGKYWVEDPAVRKVVKGKRFIFRSRLSKDGYSHAVEQMRRLLNNLSKTIFSEINPDSV